MNIYYTDVNERRRLSDCNLSESEVPGIEATDGIETYKMYMIFNTALDECTVITFGGKSRIAGNLRDCFWENIKAVYKSGIPIFDVDEWYANVNFVTPKEAARKNKKAINS